MSGAVLWDMDGTLLDSEEYHWQSWRDTMAEEGFPLTREQFRSTFGQRNDAILQTWMGAGITLEEVQRIGDTKEESYRRLVRQLGVSPLPGAGEWVKRLNEEGWLQAVASSAPRANVEVVAEVLGLADYFSAIVSAEDVERGKPDPQVFLTAASHLGADPACCIVVEDAAAGVEAARRAGMKNIGLSRFGATLKADVVVSSLADLPPDCFRNLLTRE
jgi:HAD superfamily hydrolase (TIGR01509 family)